ncbi:MAG: gamma-glutamyl-gamma-aminobutyrate hydrolase family protein [Verrucomicrobiota bacterium]
MPNLATWLRRSDEKYFAPFFARHSTLTIWNAAEGTGSLETADGLLLSGGRDIAPEFLRQPIPDPSPIEEETDARRDQWEFEAIASMMKRGLPIFAICKGMQTLNVALGGTLHLDIAGHNGREMKDADVQILRTDQYAQHRFAQVNSSHHQAVAGLGEKVEVEAWCAEDDVIEQIRVRDYPFALGVQYHPERGTIYDALFEDFFARMP